MAGMSTVVLLQQHQLFPVRAVMSTAVLLRQQQQLISGYDWEVNSCPVEATTATDFRL
jgi:hypothetical protein